MPEVTRLLDAAAAGDRQAAADLLPLVYDELRKLAAARMAQESPGHTLDPTALVHEAFLKLGAERPFATRTDYLRAAAEAMRRILVDHARARNAAKRAGTASISNPVTSSSLRRTTSRPSTTPCRGWPASTPNSPNSCNCGTSGGSPWRSVPKP